MSVLERLRQELGEMELRRLIAVWRDYCAHEGPQANVSAQHIGMCMRLLREKAS